MADFSDFRPPEINKKRPAIVVSPRLPGRSGLVSVVPVSLTPPRKVRPFHVRLSKNYHPAEPDGLESWAKCDLVMTIALWRLNGFKTGRRAWSHPQLTGEDLLAVRWAVLDGLGLRRLFDAEN